MVPSACKDLYLVHGHLHDDADTQKVLGKTVLCQHTNADTHMTHSLFPCLREVQQHRRQRLLLVCVPSNGKALDALKSDEVRDRGLAYGCVQVCTAILVTSLALGSAFS